MLQRINSNSKSNSARSGSGKFITRPPLSTAASAQTIEQTQRSHRATFAYLFCVQEKRDPFLLLYFILLSALLLLHYVKQAF